MQAVAKFKQAIEIDGSRHDTKWCLGNAYTAQVHAHHCWGRRSLERTDVWTSLGILAVTLGAVPLMKQSCSVVSHCSQ